MVQLLADLPGGLDVPPLPQLGELLAGLLSLGHHGLETLVVRALGAGRPVLRDDLRAFCSQLCERDL